MGDFQEVPGVPEVQGVPGGLLDPLRRPDLPGLLDPLRRPDLPSLPDRRRRDHLYRPLLPRDLEALQARQAPETNRSRPS
jgi:hypothetical protein